MNIVAMTRPTPDPTDAEALRSRLEGLKSHALLDAELVLASVRAERAASAQALRAACAVLQRSRDRATAEAAVKAATAELEAIDARLAAARRARDEARAPLGAALRQALRPHYAASAALVREAEAQLQAARAILATAEAFAGQSGVELTQFTPRLPDGLNALAKELEARAK
jgi:hypothetical protein